MLGRKKKRQGSNGSVDMLSSSIAPSSSSGQHSANATTTTSLSLSSAPPASSSSTTNITGGGAHDLPSSNSNSSGSRAFNYFVERARGAVGFGSRERTKSNSSEEYGIATAATSSSSHKSGGGSAHAIVNSEAARPPSRPSFGRGTSVDAGLPSAPGSVPMSIPYSASMQEIALTSRAATGGSHAQHPPAPSSAGASSSSSSSFFRRQTTLSNPLKPAWLQSDKSKRETNASSSSTLTASPSSAILSTHAGGTTSVSASGQDPLSSRRGERTTTTTGREGASPLLGASRLGYSRSSEDVTTRRQSRMWSAEDAPPVPMLTRRSTDELAREYQAGSASSTLSVEPTRRVRTTSLAPSAALNSYPSSQLSTSAPSSRGSRSPSPSPRLHASESPAPFPSSASTPNLARQAGSSFSSTTTNTTVLTSTTAATTAATHSPPEEGDRRRDSQTIHFQGFLQRKADYVPSSTPNKISPSGTTPVISSPTALIPHGSAPSYFMPRAPSPRLRPPKSHSELDLQKGWKAYRAVLKGSKLYLHKPPADLASTAKSIFPTTVVDPGATSAEPSPRTPAGFDMDGSKRRQRAYWGAGGSSHPRLIVASHSTAPRQPKVKGGTLEALAHEAVFATTFADETTSSNVSVVVGGAGEPAMDDKFLQPYETFLDTFLLFRPHISPSPGLVSSELHRFVGLAVRTSQESESTTPESIRALESRLARILEVACKTYPQDLYSVDGASEWRGAIEEVLKQLMALSTGGESKRPKELQELLIRTLEEGNKSPKVAPPRPLTDWAPAISAPSPRSGPSSVSSSPTKNRKRATTPEASQQSQVTPESMMQLTPHSLVQLDPIAFAEQIHAFHLDRFSAIAGQSLSTSRLLLRAAGLLASTDAGAKQPTVTSMFSFSPSSPHFLTRVVINSLLAPLTPTAAGPSSVVYMRAAVIAQWVSIGEELRRRGDAAGWVAIAMALCCRAVARLEETWRSVESDRIDLVRHEWAPILRSIKYLDSDDASLSTLSFEPAQTGTGIPFLGSILDEAVDALRLATAPTTEHPDAILFSPLYELREKLASVAEVWTREPLATMQFTPDARLQLFLQTSSRLPPPDKPQLSAYLTPSLEIESRIPAQGSNLLAKPRSAHDPNPLIPLIMIEPLPHISLIDRDKILTSSAGMLRPKASFNNLGGASAAPMPGVRDLSRRASYPPHAGSANLGLGAFARLRKEISDPADTLLAFADGDIVFTIVSSAVRTVPSTPTLAQNERGTLSRTSSWIESRSSRGANAANRGSGRQSLTTSLAPLSRVSSRRTSSPGANSNRSSDHGPTTPRLQAASEEEPVHVVVKAGTVEAFVDLLVVGIGNLRTPSTDADGQSSLTGRRPLELDAGDFRSAFFGTFRSFTTPLALLDMLRKRYLAAPNASQDYVNLTSERPFPTWSMAPVPAGVELDWERIASIRLGVLHNLSYWMENHIGDFLDDDELFSSTSTFLSFIEATERASARPEDDDVLAELQRLKKRIGVDAMRPAVRSRALVPSVNAPALVFDELAAGQLVDRLDQVACRVMQDLTETDLLRYIEVLETSALNDPAMWYASRSTKTDEEDLVVTDSYSLLDSAQSDNTMLRRMPLNLQQAMRAHAVVRRWVIAHLTEPDISLRQRTSRMIKALEMIEICRSRMSNVFFGGSVEAQATVLDPSLASFVERAVISAVISPESRLFASAWQNVATARHVPVADSLAALMQHDLVLTDATATLDPAWLNERLAEIVTQVDSLSDGVSINFSKRRWIFNTVRNALTIRSSQLSFATEDPLASLERKLTGWGTWSTRTLRDAASSEGSKSTRSIKPFSRLVVAQQDKIRRDRATREIVLKSQKMEQQHRVAREKEVAKAMDKSISMRTRRMTALFRGGSNRPSSVTTTSPAPIVPASPTPQALQLLKEWMPSSKPYLVLPLSGVEVQPYENAQRSYVFEVVTEDGQRSLFQASTSKELRTWLEHFKRSGTEIAFRRATFLAQTALAEEPEVPAATSKVNASAPTKVHASALFGTPLWEVLQREGTTIPRFAESAIDTISERGLLEVGIYRISGENRVIQELRQSLDRGADAAAVLSQTDVHNVTGLLKLFLREMPEPLIPYDLYEPFMTANAIDDYDERLYAIRDLAWRMPQPNFHLMRRLAEHLDKVTDHEEVNSMHAANLSIIFAPTLLKPPPGPAAFGLSMTNLGKAANIIKSFILQQNWIFGEETVEEEQEHTPSLAASRQLAADEDEDMTLIVPAGAKDDAEASIVEPIGLGLVEAPVPQADHVETVTENADATEDVVEDVEGVKAGTIPIATHGNEKTLAEDVEPSVTEPTAFEPHDEAESSADNAQTTSSTEEVDKDEDDDEEVQYATVVPMPILPDPEIGSSFAFEFEHKIVPPSPLDVEHGSLQVHHATAI